MAFWNKEKTDETVPVDMLLPVEYAKKLEAICQKHGHEYTTYPVTDDKHHFAVDLPKAKLDSVLAKYDVLAKVL